MEGKISFTIFEGISGEIAKRTQMVNNKTFLHRLQLTTESISRV